MCKMEPKVIIKGFVVSGVHPRRPKSNGGSQFSKDRKLASSLLSSSIRSNLPNNS